MYLNMREVRKGGGLENMFASALPGPLKKFSSLACRCQLECQSLRFQRLICTLWGGNFSNKYCDEEITVV